MPDIVQIRLLLDQKLLLMLLTAFLQEAVIQQPTQCQGLKCIAYCAGAMAEVVVVDMEGIGMTGEEGMTGSSLARCMPFYFQVECVPCLCPC